jgi:hypothetical protein
MILQSIAKTATPQQELMKTMNFNAKDLSMNQMGRLSERQQQVIYWQEQSRWTKPLAITVILAILLLLAVGFVIASLMLYDKDTVPQWAMVIIIGLSMFTIWGIYETVTSYRDVWLKLNSNVTGKQGIVEVDMRGFLLIGGEAFAVSPEILRRVKHLKYHVVYYLPRWKQIMSIEVLER